jgi:hypothetical protein
MLFVGKPRNDMPAGLPFKLTEYLEPVELTLFVKVVVVFFNLKTERQ